MAENNLLIFIPTYNEAGNIEVMFRALRSTGIPADILFIDDNSPDGTGKIIDRICSSDSGVHVIHRSAKQGIGTAHYQGIYWAYENKYEVLITLDCDFTHSPDQIVNFIRNSTGYDIVVGSRFLKEDSLSEWNLFRKTLTHFGHFLTKNLLRMQYDASGAFRLYNLKNINVAIFSLVQSKTYSFFFESLYILHLNGKKVLEIPINLPARHFGSSKMSWLDIFSSLSFLMNLFFRKTFSKNSLKLKTN